MYIDDTIRERVTRFLNLAGPSMGDTLGIRFESFKPDEVKGSMPVDNNTVQPFGILHGGASVTLAETLASVGGWLKLDNEEKTAVGIEINANHLRSVKKGGKVYGTATPAHIGRSIQVWEVRIENENGKLICTSRCTLAVVENEL